MKKTYYERNKAKWRGYYQTRRHKAPLYAAWRSMMIRCGLIEGGKERDLRRASGCKLQYKLVNNRVRKGWSLMRALGGK